MGNGKNSKNMAVSTEQVQKEVTYSEAMDRANEAYGYPTKHENTYQQILEVASFDIDDIIRKAQKDNDKELMKIAMKLSNKLDQFQNDLSEGKFREKQSDKIPNWYWDKVNEVHRINLGNNRNDNEYRVLRQYLEPNEKLVPNPSRR